MNPFADLSAFLANNDFIVLISLAVLAYLILNRRKMAEEWRHFRTRRGEWMKEKWKNWGEPFLVAAVLAIVIRTFLLGPYKIPSGSMIPTFLVGDRIFVDKVSYRFHPPERGDIIVFKFPLDRKKDFVKRLVGKPGDKVQIRDGKLFINGRVMNDAPFSDYYYYNREDWEFGRIGQVIWVPPENYFAMGDNSSQSNDSRNWGFIPKRNIVGKAFFIWWPPKRMKIVR